eukprot:c315_g1_i1.p1 GENE.c315_g1_i1~~c315_g1_i1.p1  ORF type:complete len:378 (-),score=35.24 c315_g1_i1:72-1205(-)
MKFVNVAIGLMLAACMVSTVSVDAAKCSKKCKNKLAGNGVCDEQCNTEECDWDDGDCITYYDYYDGEEPTPAPTKRRATPSPTRATKSPTRATKSPTSGSGSTPAPTTSSGGVDTSKYNIEIVYVGSMTTPVKDAFVRAQAKWESIIKNDIPNTYTYKKGTKCWESFTVLSQDKIVDDLMIFAQVTNIDGVNGILGSAGPCITTNTPQLYSRVGLMQFDSADMQGMVNDGTIDAVILHEMGHVIGIGTLWEDYRVAGAPNKYYTGAGGIEGQSKIQGTGKPIVEQQGGSGTAYGHWDEETYDNELMTGYAGGNEKMSLLTVLSLKDMGFTVDETKADAFTIPSARTGLRGEEEKKPKRHLGDDRIHKPFEIAEVNPY